MAKTKKTLLSNETFYSVWIAQSNNNYEESILMNQPAGSVGNC